MAPFPCSIKLRRVYWRILWWFFGGPTRRCMIFLGIVTMDCTRVGGRCLPMRRFCWTWPVTRQLGVMLRTAVFDFGHLATLFCLIKNAIFLPINKTACVKIVSFLLSNTNAQLSIMLHVVFQLRHWKLRNYNPYNVKPSHFLETWCRSSGTNASRTWHGARHFSHFYYYCDIQTKF